MASRGLIPSQQTRPNTVDDYYLRKGDPIIIESPLQISSPDKTKTGTIAEGNDGSMTITTQTGINLNTTTGNVVVNAGTNSNLIVNTNPTVATDEFGIQISRSTPTAVSASLTIDQFGTLNADVNSGSLNLQSTQGAETTAVVLSTNPFTGTVNLANVAPAPLNGNIQIQAGAGPVSRVELIAQPGAGNDSQAIIYNGIAGPNGTVGVSSSGVMKLTSSGSQVNINVDNGVKINPSSTSGDSALVIANGTASSKQTYFTTYNGSTTTGGLTIGNLQTFGYVGPAFNAKKCLDMDPEGDAVILGDSTVSGGCVVSVNGTSGTSRVYDATYNIPAKANATGVNIAPLITGTGTANAPTYKPLMVDGSGNLVVPNQPLFRYFGIQTPNSTLSAIKIIDPQGNDFNNDWICCVAGFYNSGNTTTTPDRTYACWTQPPNSSTFPGFWSVEYDNGGTAPQYVWILAISTQLYGYVNYNI